MNWVDYTMLGFLAAFFLYGFSRGFVRQLVGTLGIVASLIIAARFGPRLAEARFFDALREHNPKAPYLAGYLGVFLGSAAVTAVLSALIGRWRGPRELKRTDSFFGAVVGALEGVLILGGLSIGLLEWQVPLAAPVRQSLLAPRLAESCLSIVLLIPEKGRQDIYEEYQAGKKTVEESLPPPRRPQSEAPPRPPQSDPPGAFPPRSPKRDGGARP